MIEDAAIVKDTRRIRSLISKKFDHDLDKYVLYLLRKNVPTVSINEEKKEKD